MRTLSTSSLFALAVTSFAISLAGCAEALPPATSLASAPPAAGPDEALVTFVRPVSTCDTGSYAVVVDAHGRFLGYVAAGMRVAVPVRPGAHVFYAWGNIDYHIDKETSFNPVAAARVEAVGGQDNYVAIEVETPCTTGRTTFLMHQAQLGGGAGGDLQDWLASTKLVTVDRAAGQAEIEAKPIHLQAHMEKGQAALQKMEQTKARDARYKAVMREDAVQ